MRILFHKNFNKQYKHLSSKIKSQFRKRLKIIQVHIHKGEKYFVAECMDLPVVTQGKTLDELKELDRGTLRAIYQQASKYISAEDLHSYFYAS